MRKLLALLLLFTQLSADQENLGCFKFSFCVDPYFSMRCGSENLLSAYNGYIYLDESYLKPYISDMGGVTGGLLRLVDTIALDLPLANLAMVTQHEVFGHGARLRDNYMRAWYQIDVPVPYGPGGGMTTFSRGAFEKLSLQEQMGVWTGGIEGTERMGIDLILDRYCFGAIYVQQALLYLLAYHDETSYIYVLSDGDDISSYMEDLNEYYGEKVLSKQKLQNWTLINFLDPFFWNTFVSLWDWWVEGASCTRLPMFSVFGVDFTPGVRLHLAPYGLEYNLLSYFKAGGYVGYTYLRYGETEGRHSFGLGLEIPNVWNYASYYVGFKADLWNQPELFVPASEARPTWGARLAIRGHWFFTATNALFVELGGKTRGYLLAEPLQGRLDAKAGISFMY